MTDDEFRPEGYPEHDVDWRKARAECKVRVTDVLGEYSPPVQVAVLSEMLSRMVEEQAEDQFAREWSGDE